MNKNTALKLVLGLVCITHLLLGLVGFAAPPELIATVSQAFYGATITVTPPLQHIIRILGAFMIAIGVLGGLALRNPIQSGPIIYGIVILLCLRVLQRIIFATEIHEYFQVSYTRLWIQSILFFVLAMSLLLLRPKRHGNM